MGKKWGDDGTYLTLWFCGDDECDCHQPQLVRSIEQHGHPRWFKKETIWEGTFHSQPSSEEWEEFKREGQEAIEKFKPDFIDPFFMETP